MASPISSLDFLGLSRAEAIEKLHAVAKDLTLTERFSLLHQLGIYHGKESQSGPGSTLGETAALRNALPGLIQKHSIRSLLDIPCGDFHWMQQVDLSAIEYLGADIVPEIVARNQERFTGGQRTFALLDVTRDVLPKVDLVLCRDLLVHLNLADIERAVANLIRSGSRLLLTSHFTTCKENLEIESGDFRPINLSRAPFQFPPPITVIDEGSAMVNEASRGRSMALWAVDDLARLPSNQS